MEYSFVLIFLFLTSLVNSKKLFLLGISILFIFLALGSGNGFDWINYRFFYESEYCCSNVFHGAYEPGFISLLRFAEFSGLDFLELRVALSCFFCIAIYFFSKRSPAPSFALFAIFASFGYLAFVDQLRQGIALSVIMLFYNYFRDKRYYIFILILLIASLFHISALFFLAIVLLRFFESKEVIFPRYLVVLISLSFLIGFIILLKQENDFFMGIPFLSEKIAASLSSLDNVLDIEFAFALGRLPSWFLVALLLVIGRARFYFAAFEIVIAVILSTINFLARFNYYIWLDVVDRLSHEIKNINNLEKIGISLVFLTIGVVPIINSLHSKVIFDFSYYNQVNLDEVKERRCDQLKQSTESFWVNETCN